MQGAAEVSAQASVVNGNDKAEAAESVFLRWSLAHTGAKSTLVSNNFGLHRLPISCLSFLAFFCHRLHMFCFFFMSCNRTRGWVHQLRMLDLLVFLLNERINC